ncbi:MAG TPA: hypothetical protein PK771_08385 [Spirochaetota bacterium]|nr:hypothetical protein [Spirochaetota bacterium]
MGQTKDRIISALEGTLSHELKVKPLTIKTGIVGAVNIVAGVDKGKHEIPVDGFDIDETNTIVTALNNYQPVYCKIGSDTTNYRIIKATLTTNELTKIHIFPMLQENVADDAVVTIGGDIEITLGRIGEDGVKIKLTIESQEVLDEIGGIYKKFIKVKRGQVTFPLLHLTRENFLLFAPNSYFIVSDIDGGVKYQYGSNKGIVESASFELTCVDKKDPTNKDKTIFFEECISSVEDFNMNISESDKTVSIPLIFDVTGDKLIGFGDKTATF